MSKIVPWFNKKELNRMIKNYKSVCGRSRFKELSGLTPEEFVNHEDAPEWFCEYIIYFSKERDESFEAVIKKSPQWSFWYVADFSKERDESFEAVIKTSSQYSYWYIIMFLKKREESFEESIKESPSWSYYYVMDFLKEREESFEESIKQNDFLWKKYQEYFLTA